MILIISNNNERTTTEVIKWLSRMNKSFIRVHEHEIFDIKVDKKRIFIESERNSFFLDEITSLWYRRGGLRFKCYRYKNLSINEHMKEVQHWLSDYVVKTLESKRHVNKESNSDVNKLLVLEEAKKVGLLVPEYFLAERTNDVKINNTIIKTLAGNPIIDDLDHQTDGIMYTTVINDHENDDFFITFFQEKIEKDFEIRSFYLNEKIWSMAIFSQNDEQTQIDFRRYNLERPNRNVRYKLPEDIEQKMRLLMSKLDLNCGSFDFIKSKDQYYFLEINSVGQFLGLSKICNYSLEKEIAEYL